MDLRQRAFAPLSSLLGRGGRDRPSARPDAFRGLGLLAFVWGEGLWVLDGAGRGSLRELAKVGAGGLSWPAWSPDGRWIAGVATAGEDPRLWIVPGDGAAPHPAMDAPVGHFAWSPTQDTLAVAPQSGGLWLVPADGTPREIAAHGAPVGSLAWVPNGDALAYTLLLSSGPSDGSTGVLYTVSADGGTPTQRYAALGAALSVAAWWPKGDGLLFWVVPEHADAVADGAPLVALSLRSDTEAPEPLKLAETLLDPEWLSFSPDGQQLLLVGGTGRAAWLGKRLLVCTPATGAGTPLPSPGGTVSIDPAWAPDRATIAFVRAASSPQVEGGSAQAWMSTRALWLTRADGSAAGAVPGTETGVMVPQWARDGRHILYLQVDGLWVVDTAGGAPTRVLGPSAADPGHYGRVSWKRRFAWYQGR